MEKKTVIIVGLGGAAIVAGVGYWIYKRGQTPDPKDAPAVSAASLIARLPPAAKLRIPAMRLARLRASGPITVAVPSAAPSQKANLNRAMLRKMPREEAAEWIRIAAAGGAVPCPLQIAPLQAHCAPQPPTSVADLAWIKRQEAARRAGKAPPIAIKMRVVDLPSFRTAYDRVGGESALGKPTTPAIAIEGGKGFVQGFSGGSRGPGAIYGRFGRPAYVVSGGFYGLHTAFGGTAGTRMSSGRPRTIGIQTAMPFRIGWPLEDERTENDPTVIGIGRDDTMQTQRFDGGVKMVWHRSTGRAEVLWGPGYRRSMYDSNPPPPEEAWYENTWVVVATSIIVFPICPLCGVLIYIDGTEKSAAEVTDIVIAVATDPKVLVAVGIGLVLAPFTGGASLGPAAVVVAVAAAKEIAKRGVERIEKETGVKLLTDAEIDKGVDSIADGAA